MTRFLNKLVLGALLATCATHAGQETTSPTTLSLSRLEDRLEEIDAELQQLAHYSLRSGIGSIGYRSYRSNTAEQQEWIEVELGGEYPIDEVVLVPNIWRDTEKGFQADGFPLELRVVAGTGSNRTGTVVAEYSATDVLLPRIAPLVVPTLGITASWVRVEATRLSQRAFDGLYVLQLSELLVFSGSENMALHRPVKASSTGLGDAWNQRFLVDGFMPYLMDSAQGSQSRAFVSDFSRQSTLTLDLGNEYPLSRIHLHAVDQSDTVPQAFAGDMGIPRQLRIEGAHQPDFSDAVLLLDYRRKSTNETGPIMMWRIPEKTYRFVRLVAEEPDNVFDTGPGRPRFGFAEIELFSNGRNIALGKQAQADFMFDKINRPLATLTDGNNLYGRILPVRDWINQLARRHSLERERPLVVAELNHRYARQNVNLNRMIWLAALLGAGIGFTILIDRNLRLRQANRIKERFAADLHDELGANLHTIGLLGDLAKEAIDSPDELRELLDRSRVFTERSGAAARYCTNMLEAKNLCEDLVDEMKRSSQRLLGDLEYEISFKGEEILKGLKPRMRIDLFFFYKECLTNIIRHSGATIVLAQLKADPKTIRLSVTDNGHGLVDAEGNGIPPSLKRRARLLGSTVKADHPKEGGTCITLTLKTRNFRIGK